MSYRYCRCESVDTLIAFVHIDGRMEKIDAFCGSALPKPVMSNGPRLMLEFRGIYSSRYSRGFKATYSFTESKWRKALARVIMLYSRKTEQNVRPFENTYKRFHVIAAIRTTDIGQTLFHLKIYIITIFFHTLQLIYSSQ